MAHLYFFSSTCKDTPAFDAALAALGIDCEAVNIVENMANLKRFLQIRDTAEAYASRRGTQSVGVPVLITESGDYLFEPDELNAYFQS